MVTIVPAESNRAVLRYIPEIAWGEIPASGVSRTMRITSSSLAASKETQMSEELRADRMVPSIIEVGASTGGDFNFEYSPFSQDDFFQHFLLGEWSTAMYGLLVRGAAVRVTDTDEVTIVGADYSAWLSAGVHVKLEGFLTLANNGYFEVESVAFTGGNTVITTVETSLVVEAGSAFTKVFGAEDVILKSTLITIGADNTVDGGGADAFADLVIGQKVYLEGLGKETATMTFAAPPAAEGATFDLTDGEQTLTFEFRTNASLVEPGNVQIVPQSNPAALRTAIVAAINDQFRRQTLRFTAAAGVAGTKEAGAFEFATTAEVGDQVTVNDGANTVQFTFAAAAAGLTTVAHGASATDSAANLAAAINAHPSLNVTATPSAGDCDIVNDNYVGGALTEQTDGGADITTVNFSGGAAPTLILKNHRNTGGVLTENAAISAFSTGAFSGGDASVSGFVTVASKPNDDSFTTEETLSVNANGGGLTVVVKGSHLRNPGDPDAITKQSMTMETRFTDVNKSFQHTGQRTGSISINVNSGEIVKGSISVQGRETIPTNDSVIGAAPYTVLDTTATEIFNATSNVGEITKDGAALSTAIMGLEINAEANLREQRAVGEKFPAGIGYGRFSMSGNINAYFKDFTFFNAFIQHNTVALAFDFECLDHNKVFWRIPAVKITANPIAPEGIDRDVMEPMEWSAQRDPVLQTMLMLDRFSSVYPASVA